MGSSCGAIKNSGNTCKLPRRIDTLKYSNGCNNCLNTFTCT